MFDFENRQNMKIFNYIILSISFLIAVSFQIGLRSLILKNVLRPEQIKDLIFLIWLSPFGLLFILIMLYSIASIDVLKTVIFKKKIEFLKSSIILGGISLQLYLMNGQLMDVPMVIIAFLLSVSIALFGLCFWKIPRNEYFGVRFPWIMKDDLLWEKTHKFSTFLFLIFAIFLFSFSFFLKINLHIFLVSGGLVIFLIFLYSIIISMLG